MLNDIFLIQIIDPDNEMPEREICGRVERRFQGRKNISHVGVSKCFLIDGRRMAAWLMDLGLVFARSGFDGFAPCWDILEKAKWQRKTDRGKSRQKGG